LSSNLAQRERSVAFISVRVAWNFCPGVKIRKGEPLALSAGLLDRP
jgi:hypothetical protein